MYNVIKRGKLLYTHSVWLKNTSKRRICLCGS